MFQFGGFPSVNYGFIYGSMILHHGGFPIRKSTDQCLFPTPRGFSQVVASFFGSWCQGIHLMLFFAWTASLAYSLESSSSLLAWVIANNCLGCKFKKTFLNSLFFRRWLLSPAAKSVLPSIRKNLNFLMFFSIQLSVSFLYSVFNEHFHSPHQKSLRPFACFPDTVNW